MSEVTPRRFLAAGAAAGAGIVPGGWTATARGGSAAPREVLAADDLALWYDKPAGADWLRALPIGNGRLGAMVFANVDTERLRLNEDTVWAGGPYDSANPRGAADIAEIRRRVFADQWGPAQDLINQAMLGSPAGQLAHQPVGNLRLSLGSATGASQYHARLIQWQITAGSNQHFEFLPSDGGHCKIRLGHSGLFLHVSNSSSGADITQQPDTDTTGQQWRTVHHGGGVISLVNRQSGLAPDVWEASTADGARISPWAATGSTNQRFQLHRIQPQGELRSHRPVRAMSPSSEGVA
jgi:hypothetical protein